MTNEKDNSSELHTKFERWLISQASRELSLEDIAKQLGITADEVSIVFERIDTSEGGVPDLRKLN